MSATAQTAFATVTEQPGQSASRLQLAMMAARYEWARRHCAGRDVLEVACGSGTGLGALAEVARSVAACDVDGVNLAAAKLTYRDASIDIRYGDAHRLPYADAAFDTVLLFEAIYYLADAGAFLREAGRVLRPGGSLLIAPVNCHWTGFNPSPYHVHYYPAGELTDLLSQHGFRTTIEAGYPEHRSTLGVVVGHLRRAAVAMHLVPRTMAGKALLKRLFYGPLEAIPDRLDVDRFKPEPFSSLAAAGELTRHRVLYAHARKPEAQGL